MRSRLASSHSWTELDAFLSGVHENYRATIIIAVADQWGRH
jgi:hypothetical protein